MIVRTLDEAKNTSRRVVSPKDDWESIRLILANDDVGFSFHITTIYAGKELHLHYKNHFESVYCMEGHGNIEVCDTGEVHRVSPGTIYVLDKNDKHILRSESEMKMACVFNPPVTGFEVHRDDGSYALEERG